MKHFAMLAALLALTAPALGQTADFQQILTGKDFATTLKVKDLNADWRRLSITRNDNPMGGMGDMLSNIMQMAAMSEMGKKGQGQNDAMGAMMGMSMLGGMFGGGSGEPVYYTKGQTVTLGGETFLVTYRYQKPQLDFMKLAMESGAQGGKEPDLAKLMAEGKMTPDSDLSLALVNVKSMSMLTGIRPFDLDKEIAENSKGGGLMDLLTLGQTRSETGNTATVETTPATPVTHATPSADIAAEGVKQAIAGDAQLKSAGNRITVTSASGKVVLKGTVRSAALKARAAIVAKRAIADAGENVVISNQITVKAGGR